jgi:hypothetical protein
VPLRLIDVTNAYPDTLPLLTARRSTGAYNQFNEFFLNVVDGADDYTPSK